MFFRERIEDFYFSKGHAKVPKNSPAQQIQVLLKQIQTPITSFLQSFLRKSVNFL